MRMPIGLIVASTLLGIARPGLSQELTGGLKGGVTVATLDAEDEECESRAGVIGGGFLRIRVTDMCSIQPEAGVEVSRFIIEGRYNMGLTNVAKEGDEVKNRAFSVLAGVRF